MNFSTVELQNVISSSLQLFTESDFLKEFQSQQVNYKKLYKLHSDTIIFGAINFVVTLHVSGTFRKKVADYLVSYRQQYRNKINSDGNKAIYLYLLFVFKKKHPNTRQYVQLIKVLDRKSTTRSEGQQRKREINYIACTIRNNHQNLGNDIEKSNKLDHDN
ncbi:hypothetical protein V1478_008573 [Vespula squamosa]|uniref:LAGLIDADG homing endonuclease n=1 Tax=Vespula squamosa TaxID=30214 RepID=A0ABD2AVW7_VESSQ